MAKAPTPHALNRTLTRYSTQEEYAREILAVAESILHAQCRDGILMADPTVAGRYFATRLRMLDREEFHVAFLDTRHRLIACESLFQGSIDGAEVHPRIVAQRALHHKAAGGGHTGAQSSLREYRGELRGPCLHDAVEASIGTPRYPHS